MFWLKVPIKRTRILLSEVLLINFPNDIINFIEFLDLDPTTYILLCRKLGSYILWTLNIHIFALKINPVPPKHNHVSTKFWAGMYLLYLVDQIILNALFLFRISLSQLICVKMKLFWRNNSLKITQVPTIYIHI